MKRALLSLAVLCVAIFLVRLSAAQERSASPRFVITLKRVGCLGTCPDYQVTILGDGSVRYHGHAYVRVYGVHKRKIPVKDINALIETLKREHFFEWQKQEKVCVDFPEVEITASLGAASNDVIEGCNSPGKVLALADEIDRIAGVKRWVGAAHSH